MALNPGTKYVGRITAPTTAYPYGSSKNESSPGAGDGTPYEQARADDVFGMQQALLKSRGIVPNGNSDEVRDSQYLQALVEIAAGAAQYYTDSGAANAYVLDIANADSQGPTQYFDGMRAMFRPSASNTGASTVNVAGLGVKNIKTKDGDDPLARVVTASRLTLLIYDAANGWFELVPIGETFESGTLVDATNGGANDLTEIDFTLKTGNPKKISITFDGISLTGTDNVLVQLGDSGGVETSGYSGTSVLTDGSTGQNAGTSSGFPIRLSNSAVALRGVMELVNIDGNDWAQSHSMRASSTEIVTGGGIKELSGPITTIRITISGADTFDAGDINILEES